jgi:hypothetical protein
MDGARLLILDEILADRQPMLYARELEDLPEYARPDPGTATEN